MHIVLEVKKHRRTTINDMPYDEYLLKVKQGDNISITRAIGSASDEILEAGCVIKNMQILRRLASDEFAKEWYEAKAIEESVIIEKKNQKTHTRNKYLESKQKRTKKETYYEKREVQQLSLF